MSVLTRDELYRRIVEAIQASGCQVLWPSDPTSVPLDLRVFQNEASLTLKIYIWNVTHGGKTRSEDEYRIQVQVSRFQRAPDYKTLVLGWWEDAGVFAGFDVRSHAGELGNPSSIQVKEPTLREAARVGLSAQERGNNEIVIAFRPELFIEYGTNLEPLHDFGDDTIELEALQNLVGNAEKDDSTLNSDDLSSVSLPRRKTVVTIIRKIRESAFTRRILSAYGYQCSFCVVQLELVEAAHILPVAYDGSTDETSNGIALCPLHHRAYDRGLITVDENYVTMRNREKVKQLQNANRAAGLRYFFDGLQQRIRLPHSSKHWPSKTFIIKANELRGWRRN